VISRETEGSRKRKSGAKYTQLLLVDPENSGEKDFDPVAEEIRDLDLNNLTPMEALNRLHAIQQKLKES
jgi:DNA mismatch repair protein MutS